MIQEVKVENQRVERNVGGITDVRVCIALTAWWCCVVWFRGYRDVGTSRRAVRCESW
jgi:hypothetical protein